MKYVPPKAGPCEGALNSASLYNIVNQLIGEHAKIEDIRKILREPGFSLAKIWLKDDIRSELKEYLASYFFSNSLLVPGFEKAFRVDGTLDERILDYAPGLNESASRMEKFEAVTSALKDFQIRHNRLFSEIYKIPALEEGEVIGPDLRFVGRLLAACLLERKISSLSAKEAFTSNLDPFVSILKKNALDSFAHVITPYVYPEYQIGILLSQS
ncbi:hypothetical protein HYS31_07615 [Candidatus Woesearchaeota archaeon]|nr:hypothetical protein [Candidatus Woesearchaeota archaeon]